MKGDSAAFKAVHGGAFDFAFGVPFAGVLALIELDFALADAEGDLDLVVLPIEREGDQGAALGGARLGEFAEFALVQEQFAGSPRGVIIEVAVRILFDVGVVQPEFAVLDAGKGVPDFWPRPARRDFTSVPRKAIPAS